MLAHQLGHLRDRAIARRVNESAIELARGLRRLGWRVATRSYFDTIVIDTGSMTEPIHRRATTSEINLRRLDATRIGISVDETTTPADTPTISFPVVGTLMFEPTESEPIAELERFCIAMIVIRNEIATIEAGRWPHDDNPLKNAPHTPCALATEPWTHPYSRIVAVFPVASLRRSNTAREGIHHFVRAVLSKRELDDALILAAAALVVLPLVPDRFVGPLDAINPRTVWLLVILTMAIAAIGHVAQRALGTRYGLPLAGFAGGFVSSSATIGTMGALARQTPALRSAAASGAVLSSVATVVHLALVLGATSPETLYAFALPLGTAGAAAAGYGLFVMTRPVPAEVTTETYSGDAFSITSAAVIGVGLSAVLVLAAVLREWLGAPGIAIAAGAAGLADVQSAAISTASLVAAEKIVPRDAVLPIMIAISTNTVTKIIFAWTGGGAAFTAQVAPGLLLIVAAAWGATYWV